MTRTGIDRGDANAVRATKKRQQQLLRFPAKDDKVQGPRAVLYLHSSDDLYGADAILLQLVTGLDRTRFRPIVVLPDDMRHVGLLSRELEAAGIEYHHMPIAILRRRYMSAFGLLALLRRFVQGTWAVGRIVRENEVTLLHGFTLAVIAAPVAAVVLRLPLLMHAHEIVLRPRLLRKGLHGLAARTARTVLCVSDAVRSNIVEDEPWAAAKVVVIRNGIAAAEQRRETQAELRQELGVPQDKADKPLVGMIGRVSAWKGQEVFVRAASLLQAEGVACHFVAIGGVFDGETKHMDNLLRVIADSNAADAVTVVGFRKNARGYLAAFDVFVLPSTEPEPFGTVILEAMAASVPVIATAHGGPLEMVVDGETGVLVAPGDPVALARAVTALLGDPEKAQSMGHAGQKRFDALFSLQRYLAEVQGLYSTIQANPKAGVP